MLDKVDKAKGTDSKKKTFATFLSQWREAHKKLHPTDADSTVSTYIAVPEGGGAIIGNTVDIIIMYSVSCKFQANLYSITCSSYRRTH